MTRLAFISDVHADVHAVRDALRRIDELGVECIFCCGDLVDYGLFPELKREVCT
jgi:predicted phosphodiesterase